MTSKEEVDLSAFPIVRLDQIGLLNDKTLKECLDEVSSMMDRSDFSQQRMAKYLRKQYESMLFEYNERQAAVRVQLLLSGAVEALNQTYSPRIDPRPSLSAEQSSNTSRSVNTVATEPPKEAPKSQDGFLVTKKLVLRDTPVSHNTTTASTRSEVSKPVTEVRTVSDATLQLPIPSRHQSDSSSVSQPSESSTVVARFSDNASTASGGANTTDATTTPRSTGTKTPRVRKSESPAAEENLPSKKSVEIVYRNFGNEFIVAATERKRRFVPKKEPVETEEERKARERQERRKIAMERLVKRRETQENHKQQLREQRRQEKLRKLRRERGDDSSDSESVSGGDDDADVKVDEALLPAVQATVIDNGERSFVVKLAPGQRPRPKPKPIASSVKPTGARSNENASSSERSAKPPLPSVPRRTSTKAVGGTKTSASRQTDRIVMKDGGSDDDDEEQPPTGDAETGDGHSASVATDEVEGAERDEAGDQDASQSEDEEVASIAQTNDGGPTAASSQEVEDADAVAPSTISVPLPEGHPPAGTARDSSDSDDDAPALFGGNHAWSSKNLSALATIRKLKDAKAGKSISRSMDPLDDDDDAVPTALPPQSLPPPSQRTDWVIPSVEDIVARAMGAVERATTPHLLSTRPSSRAISTATDSVASARVWSFDDMLPMLLTALHVQRVVHAAEVDLLQVMGDTVMFNFGPDDLPGLRALQLVHHRPLAGHVRAGAVGRSGTDAQTREFRVSLEEYHNRIYSEENAEIFDYRSMKRREISLGLILLAITSHRILFGKVAINTTDDFNQAWLAAIQAFDNQASRAAAEGQETAYFALVQVCGNGYAICKKLEVLLESYFAPLFGDHVPAAPAALTSRRLMSRCLSARGVEGLSGVDDDAVGSLRPRRDSQDSLLDFLNVRPVLPPGEATVVAGAAAAAAERLPPPREEAFASLLAAKGVGNLPTIDTSQTSQLPPPASYDSDDRPPPSSAAASILSLSNPSSRPTSSSAAALASQRRPGSNAAQTTSSWLVPPTVFTGPTATEMLGPATRLNEGVEAAADEASAAMEYRLSARPVTGQRPLSGRRSAAAAKFRANYLGHSDDDGTSAVSASSNAPVAATAAAASTNGEPDRLTAQRQRLADLAQSLTAGDVFDANSSVASTLPTVASTAASARAPQRPQITFSQLEEELAAADAALAYVLQQQQTKATPDAAGTGSAQQRSSSVTRRSASSVTVGNSKATTATSATKKSTDKSTTSSSGKDKDRDRDRDSKDRVLGETNNRRKKHALPSESRVASTSSSSAMTTSNGEPLAEGERPPLISYYPQFAMIFPMAYSQSQQARDDMGYARVILESMNVQAKVYEEWVEVMRDYSTVFCHHGLSAGDADSDAASDAGGDGSSVVAKQRVGGTGAKRPRRPRSVDIGGDHDADDGDGGSDGDGGGAIATTTATATADEERRRSAAVYKGGNRALHYRVKSSRSEVFNIVCDVFQQMLPQWENLPAGLGLGLSWNLLWTWSKPRINHSHLLIWQKVNHFEESRQLTRKDFLKKNLQRYTDMPHSLAKEFEIMPLTFLLPHEYNAFVSAFTSLESQKIAQQQQQQQQLQHGTATDPAGPPVAVTLNYWILKPVGLSRGRGISLIRDLGDLTYAQASVIQKYVENPLCLQQYKFDLRIYVVVTSFKPLEAFIYREGFARVSLEAYSTQPQDMDNLFIHLTNSSIQKKHISGPSKDNPVQTGHDSGADVEVGGSKISLLGQHGLWKRLELYSQGRIQSEDVWQAICTLIVKSLVVVDDKIPHQPNCFELFGYDVLIDSNLRPWLIEVNASPSLARENALDHRVKNALIRDIIELLDVAPFDRAALARVMRRRLNNIAKQRHVHGRNDAELEQDLQDILGDYRPRRHGEMPAKMGQFERLAPDTPHFEKVLKLKKKLFKDA